MGFENSNTQGSKNTNAQWQRAVLKLLEDITNRDANDLVSGDSAPIVTNVASQVISAQGVGVYIYITSVLVTNSHETVGTLVSLQDGAGTLIPGATGYAAAAGGGYSITFPTSSPLKMPVANQNLMAICGTTGANVYVSVSGYKGD